MICMKYNVLSVCKCIDSSYPRNRFCGTLLISPGRSSPNLLNISINILLSKNFQYWHGLKCQYLPVLLVVQLIACLWNGRSLKGKGKINIFMSLKRYYNVMLKGSSKSYHVLMYQVCLFLSSLDC
jgi:hypothetical protein